MSKILDLKSSSEQIFFQKLLLGAPDCKQSVFSRKFKYARTVKQKLKMESETGERH